MGWKRFKVEKAVLDIIRGMLTYVFRNILFPDLFPEDIEVSGFQIYFGDYPESGTQIIYNGEEDEVSIFVPATV